MEPKGLAVPPLERTRLVDEVTDRLRTLILDGSLLPGQPLLQAHLSERLGISRTPLREALRILESEGFLHVVNGNKTLEVVELTPTHMVELYQFREVIDGLAARLAARRGLDAAASQRMHERLAKITASSSALDPIRRAAHHADFHAALAEASGNRYVITQIPMIRLTAQMLARRMSQLHTEQPAFGSELREEGVADHTAVLAAIESRDARAAEATARRHIRKTIRTILDQFVDSQV
ncbi:MAG: GntR family transcriptional regulator [Acidimicrobiales bacterium]|nr:GntR family transcriptional regulator [Acidimicrobiales bacterium]